MKEYVFGQSRRVENFAEPTSKSASKENEAASKALRKREYFHILEPLIVQDQNFFSEPQVQPILFEEVLINSKCKEEKSLFIRRNSLSTALHLVIFVHGFQANSFDMRIFRNNIAMKCSKGYLFLCSSANEEQTEGDINFMALCLVREIKNYLSEWSLNESNLSKISFVSHSLGGIIVRAALPHLSFLKNKFYSYISLSSPHLGNGKNPSKLVSAGLWFLKKWRKSLCLQQLTMTDESEYEKTFLYKLSTQPVLYSPPFNLRVSHGSRT